VVQWVSALDHRIPSQDESRLEQSQGDQLQAQAVKGTEYYRGGLGSGLIEGIENHAEKLNE